MTERERDKEQTDPSDEHSAQALNADETGYEQADASDHVDDAGDDNSSDVETQYAADPVSEYGEETDESGDEPPIPPAVVPPVKPRGRGLAIFALFLALAAAAGVGYLYYLLIYNDPLAQVRNDAEQVTGEFEAFRSEIDTQISAVDSQAVQQLEAFRAEQTERIAASEEGVSKSLAQALQAAPPSQREWQLAEAEYLMRIANHRVLMEQDALGALGLLQAADQIIEELDDFALHQVRVRLADEIISLKQVRRQDLQGIYLRLEAIKAGVGRLPLLTPDLPEEAGPASEDESVWQVLGQEFKQLVRIRTVQADEAIKPLLAPEELRYLELNLRLTLEQAQLATLKRQQDVFEQSLVNVDAWLSAHADTSQEATQALLIEVKELGTTQLAAPLPEISNSLNELLDVRRGGS